MKILGIEPNSLLEWKKHISYVIFLGKCNFRCPWCYAPHLVFEKTQELNKQEIIEDIKQRKNFLNAICITGGEPTIHPELPGFLSKLKEINIPIRIETNGSKPDMIKQLIERKLVDSIVLDIKNSKEKYNETCGTNVNLENIQETIDIIKASNIDHEFRTTLVPELHELEDIEKIISWVGEKPTLKQFRSDLANESTLNPDFLEKGNYPQEKINNINNHVSLKV